MQISVKSVFHKKPDTQCYFLISLSVPAFPTLPTSLSLWMSVCQSLFGSPHSYLNCIFISVLVLGLHSLQPNKVLMERRGGGHRGRWRTVGKRSDNRNQKYFPTNRFWSVHTSQFLLACLYLRNHIDEGKRT